MPSGFTYYKPVLNHLRKIGSGDTELALQIFSDEETFLDILRNLLYRLFSVAAQCQRSWPCIDPQHRAGHVDDQFDRVQLGAYLLGQFFCFLRCIPMQNRDVLVFFPLQEVGEFVDDQFDSFLVGSHKSCRLDQAGFIREFEANRFRLVSQWEHIKDSQYGLVLEKN